MAATLRSVQCTLAGGRLARVAATSSSSLPPPPPPSSSSTRLLHRCCRLKSSNSSSSSSSSSKSLRHQQQQQREQIACLPRSGHFYANPFTPADYVDRRRRLFNELTLSPQFNKFDRHLLLVPSAQQLYMAHHVPYTLRQNSQLRYLTGHCGADSLLALACSREADDFEVALFVHSQSPAERQWDGPDASLSEVAQATGCQLTMYTEEEATNFLISRLGPSGEGRTALWYNYNEPPNPGLDRTVILPAVQKRSPQGVLNVELLIDRLRWRKSPGELAAMRTAGEIGAAAMLAAMQASSPGVNEALLWTVLDFESRRLGADRLAYPPVIGGGERANTIHYMRNNQTVAGDELVLIDSGAEVHGYVSDITRAWPVGGRFNREQRILYEIVQQVLADCESHCQVGATLDGAHLLMGEKFKKYLAEAGALSESGQRSSAQSLCQSLCPHHVSHYLGMDVHDTPTVPRSTPLESGVTFPLEPGLYSGPESQALRPEFRGLGGVRLENDYAIGEDGSLLLLNPGAPLTADEVENAAGAGFVARLPGE